MATWSRGDVDVVLGSTPLFAEPSVESDFQRHGYATVPLLSRERASELLAEVRAAYPEGRTGITFANVEEDRAFVRAVSELMTPIWDDSLGEVFPRHRVAFTTCVIKHPGMGSLMSAHDDGTFVDPRRHRSATVWVSLTDCMPDDRNGMIAVLPGSHRVVSTSAGANVPEWHRPYRGFLTEHLRPVPTHAGEAVVWDSRLLHGSPPNESGDLRVAVVAELVPREAKLLHVQALSRTKRRVFEVDEAFHLEHSPIAVRDRMPPYPEVARFEEAVEVVGPERVARLCNSAELPQEELQRPPDDWFGPSTPHDGVPLAEPGDHGIDGQLSEALCVSTHLELAAAISDGWRGLDEQGRHAGRSVGEWGSVDLVIDGRMTPEARALMPRTAGAAAAGGVRDAFLLALGPGASVAFLGEDVAEVEVHLPLATPVSGGLATARTTHAFELGLPVCLDRRVDRQFWNGDQIELRLLILRNYRTTSRPRGWLDRLKAFANR